MQGLDGRMMGLLERLLDVAARKQSVIATNIANVDTPGYRARSVDFEAAMRESAGPDGPAGAGGPVRMARTSPGHLVPGREAGGVRVSETKDLTRRNDLNNVSLDRELLDLGRTAETYSTGIELVRKRIALLRYAIQEGRSS